MNAAIIDMTAEGINDFNNLRKLKLIRLPAIYILKDQSINVPTAAAIATPYMPCEIPAMISTIVRIFVKRFTLNCKSVLF